jgi:Ferritin-like
LAKPRIVWKHNSVIEDFSYTIGEPTGFATASSADTKRLLESIKAFGIPQVQGAATPKEDAVGLLMLAAEIEHALMVQYLYAAQSTRGVAGRMVSHIAVQEMGHLVTVQNLLLCLEGIGQDGIPSRIHLGRDELRRSSTFNPIPLVLEPISKIALSKFIVAERPDEIDDENLRARVEALEATLNNSGIDPKPIYALYFAIRWIFQREDSDADGPSARLGFKKGWHLSDEDFVDSDLTKPFSSEPIEWGSIPGLVVVPVKGRTSALSALNEITEQGEGAPGSHESHFHDFVSVLDKFEAGAVAVKPLPRTPYTDFQPAPEDSHGTKIKNPYTILWIRFFDVVYELLLLDIAWGLSLSRNASSRTQIIDVCIDTMNQIIQPLAAHIADKPVDAVDGPKAGPAYGLNNEDLPNTKSAFSTQYSTVLSQRDALIAKIQSHADFGSDISGLLILSTIPTIDLQRKPHLP